MKDSLYLALDNCLTMIDQGSDLETCLVRYPEYATELRPLLLAAKDAESIAEDYVPTEVLRQGKAKFLNAAAEIREQKSSKKVFGFFPLRRAVRFSFTALVAAVFVVGIGGTGLVNASGGSLPGDKLYPVKLSWENIQLKLVSAQPERDVLIDKFDQERVHEVNALINSKRLENVRFYGQIDGIFPDQIIVSGVTVTILPSTKIDGEIQMNSFALVEGQTQSDGMVLADRIQIESIKEESLTPPGDNKKSNSGGNDTNQGGGNSDENKSGITQTQEFEQSKTPEPEEIDSTVTEKFVPVKNTATPEKDNSPSKTKGFEIEGIVNSYNGSMIEVSGKSIFIIPETQIKGSPSGGSQVKIYGYVNSNGDLIARSIEVHSDSSSGGGGGQSGGGESDGSHHHYDPSRTPDPDKTPDD
jgi:uncharacterized membrane protein YgcG